ncbi:hypothetical protein SSPS47_24350 [Streptomyces sp. S4.7]|uniref:hypothetical protein n=1 Tax=Streptomyces sp. S4.7 TaxID=2705439 RepID=UPI0013976B2D|nr:hypothetical protein [Streptomyces sp. S4.7]QHY98251.1 hypothetical protein SSPS47_24350 [Streptomyces sp. S4.7]
MGGFLSELGKKLAERWLSLLVLPGALYLAVAATAHTLGHTHPFDLPHLTQQITTWANHPATSTAGGQVVLLAATLAAAAAAGLAAQALGSLTEWLCLAADWHTWPLPLRQFASRQTTRRRGRWTRAARIWHHRREQDARTRAQGQRADPAARHAAERAMTRIAPEEPSRPTWSGDRLNAVAVRLERDHHLDLTTLWPHVWLILPEETRTQITFARQNLTRATTLTAWALLYLPLTAWWWPAALITTTLTLTGWARTRTATETYALLLEATARLHTRDLADRLGLNPTGRPTTLTPETGDSLGLNLSGPFTPETGDALTHHLTPTPPPPPTG